MAAGAAVIVIGSVVLARRFVRIVARQAGEGAAALLKARALVQIDGLVAYIPSVIPVDGDSLRRRRPVALAAERVQLRR